MTDVGGKNLVAWRKALGYIAAAVMLFVGATSAGAADLLGNSGTVTDQITNFADQARAAGGSAPSVANPATAAPVDSTSSNEEIAVFSFGPAVVPLVCPGSLYFFHESVRM
jgi:hypothetical protein